MSGAAVIEPQRDVPATTLQPDRNKHAGKKLTTAAFASSVTSLAIKSYKAVEPHATRVVRGQLNDGSLVRWPQELFHSQLQEPFVKAIDYTPLPKPSSIRILTIYPGDPNATIKCSLRIADISEPPRFRALSYSWQKDGSIVQGTVKHFWRYVGLDTEPLEEEEPEEVDRIIICDGKALKIKPNLYHALLLLRSSSIVDGSPMDIWVDAICINQDNPAEQSAQVEIMGQIYKYADEVVVWLGECPHIYSKAIQKIEHLKGELGYHFLPDGVKEEQGLVLLAAVFLLQRRYFRRLWILQEFCLAKRMVMYLGIYTISTKTLESIVRWSQQMNSRIDEVSRQFIAMVFRNSYREVTAVPLIPRLIEAYTNIQSGGALTMEEWLELSKGHAASDHRDFVNGGLSLIKPEELTINSHVMCPTNPRLLWPRLKADYRVSTTKVLLNLSACLLTRPRSVELLLGYAFRVRDSMGIDGDFSATRYQTFDLEKKSQVGDKVRIIAMQEGVTTARDRQVNVGQIPQEDDELAILPSWVPNPGSVSCSFLSSFASDGFRDFSACGNLTGQPTISADGRSLYLEATKLAVVEKTFANPYMRHKSLLDFCLAIPAQFPDGRSGLEAIAEMWYARDLDPAAREEAVKEVMSILREGKLDFDKAAEGPHSKKDLLSMVRNKPVKPKIHGYEVLEEKFPEFGKYMTHKKLHMSKKRQVEGAGSLDMTWRSFFTLKDSGLIGLGPSWMEEGDQIMLVKGSPVPYIFRHVDKVMANKVKILRAELEGKDKKAPSLSRKDKRVLKDRLRETEENVGKRDGWILIGEAFVRGLMKGEAVTPETPFEMITIV